LSPSGYLWALVVIIGLGALLNVSRSINRKADGKRKGGKAMKKRMVMLFAATLETLWVAAAGSLQAPEG
jgi:hypothetical protein